MATNPIDGRGPLPLDPRGSARQTRTEGSADPGATGKGRRAEESESTQGATRKGGPGEKVQISQEAQELLRLKDLMSAGKKALEESPDVRAEKVREVKERMKAGVYQTQGVRDELAHRLTSILRGVSLDDED